MITCMPHVGLCFAGTGVPRCCVHPHVVSPIDVYCDIKAEQAQPLCLNVNSARVPIHGPERTH